MTHARFRMGLLAAASLLPGVAFGQSAASQGAAGQSAASQSAAGQAAVSGANQPEQVTVVGISPMPGTGIDRNLVPQSVQVLTPAEIAVNGNADVLNALSTFTAGVNLDSASGNPYQPSLFYDGFEVSPLQGTPQGVAVYVNGVRFNQPFGDTVNWDLLPDVAIRNFTVEGSNPVFGLNALGGAFAATMKDGFSYQGGEADLSGGSFGTVNFNAQYGWKWGDQALYVAGSVQHQGGWRNGQSTDIQNFYGDYGVRSERWEVHATLDMANSNINEPATAPVQLIAADPAAVFTSPNADANRYIQGTLRGSYKFSDTLSVQGQAYYNYFLEKIANGNTANDFPCDNGTGLMCQAPGVPSTTRGGGYIPALFGPNPQGYSELDTNTTNTNAYGAAFQVTESAKLLGHANHLTAGASYDGAGTEFSATPFLGGISQVSRVYLGPGSVIDEPGGTVPVRTAITDTYAGVYATDTFNVTKRLAVTAAGRFNFAEIDLNDQGGGSLTGRHAYARFNPQIGATYKLARYATLYASYAEANRAPTPAELSCAGPQNSCTLANFFVGDPNLKQVVSHSWQGGVRGEVAIPGGTLHYDANLFHVTSDDDIIFVNSVLLNRAFFRNVGQTLRQGGAVSLQADFAGFDTYVNYTYVAATYQTGFVESAGNNPAADANGNITIRPGDMLPGIPRNVLKFGFDAKPTSRLSLGAQGILQSGQFLYGDEANLTPQLPGYFVTNLHAQYKVRDGVALFGSIQNAFNRQYYTFGTFSSTTAVYLAQAPNATNPRAYTVAAPIAVYAGVKVFF